MPVWPLNKPHLLMSMIHPAQGYGATAGSMPPFICSSISPSIRASPPQPPSPHQMSFKLLLRSTPTNNPEKTALQAPGGQQARYTRCTWLYIWLYTWLYPQTGNTMWQLTVESLYNDRLDPIALQHARSDLFGSLWPTDQLHL